MKKGLFFLPTIVLLLLLSLLLAGCGSKSAPQPTATATLPPRPTATPTTATKIATPTPTHAVIKPTPTTNASPTPTPEPAVNAIVTGSVVNLRGGPGTGYPVLRLVRQGTKLSIVGKSADGKWWQSGAPHAGWIFGDLLNFSSSTSNIPVVTVTPPPKATTPPKSSASNDFTLPPAGNFPAPTGNIDPLTGLAIDPNRLQHQPLLVAINNSKVARPQYGLNSADVVYEYVMEGWWVTRLTGIFWGEDAKEIGPVRSGRLINHYMTTLYDGALTCSGASDKVRWILKHDPFPYFDIDLDDPTNHYTWSVGHYWETRLRTDSTKLRAWFVDHHKDRVPHLRGFSFGALPAGGKPGLSFHIPYPASSTVDWRYDAHSGRYWRYVQGVPALDKNDGKQVSAANVIVQFVPHQTTNIIEDSLGSRSILIDLYGEGRALIFRDGKVFDGKWVSRTQGDSPHFFTADGQPIPLKRGNSWFQIVPTNYQINIAGQ